MVFFCHIDLVPSYKKINAFKVNTFSWVWIPLFPCGMFFSMFGVSFSLIRVPLCTLVSACFDGVCPKDASNGMPLFGGDFMESQQYYIRMC